MSIQQHHSLSVCIASHNTLSSRPEALKTCLNALDASIEHFQQHYPKHTINVSWVDDASTDRTWQYVQDNIKAPLIGLRLDRCSQQGYARNLASKLSSSDYLLFCDSDDCFYPDHITKAYQAIKTPIYKGKENAIACMTADMDEKLKIHPEWISKISYSIPITKIVRRIAWEFIEGFPVHDLYKRTPVEDQDLMVLMSSIFDIKFSDEKTVEYCCYPNSSFERQLSKFQQDPELQQMSEDDKQNLSIHQARETFLAAKLELLKAKLIHDGWHERLLPFAVKYSVG